MQIAHAIENSTPWSTENASDEEILWLLQVDAVDPFFGSAAELSDLLASAPTAELKTWLALQIEANETFKAHLFSVRK